MKDTFLASPTETSVNAFLVNTGEKLILIDAGTGVLFGPTLGNLPANLAAAGYKPEQVDDIFITHMHPDHVGGLVVDGKPFFPKAVVHVDKADADFWLSPTTQGTSDMMKSFLQGAQLSLAPYVSAGKLAPFEGDKEIVPGVAPWASHGYAPDHSSYVVESKDERLVVIGDLIHVASIQLADPSITIDHDADNEAAATQRAILALLPAGVFGACWLRRLKARSGTICLCFDDAPFVQSVATETERHSARIAASFRCLSSMERP